MWQYFEEIEKTSKSTEKIELLEFWLKEFDYIAPQLLRLTLSPYKVFGVSAKSIEKATGVKKKGCKDIGQALYEAKKNDSIASGATAREFVDFSKYIKEVSGNEAISVLAEFFAKCNCLQAKWFARILCKDLKCGVSIATANKALKNAGFASIEKFEVGLCGLWPNKKEALIEKANELLLQDTFVFCEPKYDGIRLILSNTSGKTIAQTRNGKIKFNVEFLLKEFDRLVGDRKITLDGELMSKDFFDVSKKVEDGKKGDRYFVVFDILHIDGYDCRKDQYSTRREILEEILTKTNIDSKDTFQLIESREAHTFQDLWDEFQQAVEDGYEGLVVKTNTPYTETYKRKNWFKIKPVKEGTFRVIEVFEGTGKNTGLISAIRVGDKSGTLDTQVGSGFTDKDIEYMTDNPNKTLGRLAEIKFDCITPEQDGLRALRFPRFVKWRDDIEEEDSI